ncbi:5-hydroxytryptamine receptor-like isoform X2 [Dinothrombium tinctorium]|uniref:5-hydroxytryptamine receptor-like isoform X2 n=1 Tax=Dinothrombium tinctorium TaxID=1965070 RepID=A0A3S3PQK5_9ACAR|nr:5-hydroxytryptamine receptor-like isoform X2 [Dinothrombium tinctorium]RWS06869.1 5-hydroxytryptamine receptor-like isoform X2 [Dinothrombium tinctorium]RWS07087.1 5-hydroxytryptamine receptor-like isoform X2 [Dinothrombium tinctorium]
MNDSSQEVNTKARSKETDWPTYLLLLGGLVVLIASTIFGNILVILAILREKSLKLTSNYLILSLAITDLLLACLVMPISSIYGINGEWNFGSTLCDIWLAADVLCCTASILHLLAIAFDRYLALTNIDYIHHRGKKHVGGMIFIIWLVAAIISLAPTFGWKDADFESRLRIEKLCLYSQDLSYQLFATFFSFYGPVVFILFLYYKVYQVAKTRIRRKATTENRVCSSETKNRAVLSNKLSIDKQEVTVAVVTASSSGIGSEPTASTVDLSPSARPSRVQIETPAFTSPIIEEKSSDTTQSQNNNTSKPGDIQISIPKLNLPNANAEEKSSFRIPLKIFKRLWSERESDHTVTETRLEALSSARERRAAKILMIITGAFVCCWLPFFILAILMPICPECNFNRFFTICLWLGYMNSTINPILYTFFSPDFRTAFKKILLCKCM